MDEPDQLRPAIEEALGDGYGHHHSSTGATRQDWEDGWSLGD